MKSMTKQRTFRPAPTRSLLRWIPHFFFVVGILALGYVAVALLQASLYQAHEARRFDQARQAQMSTAPSSGSETPEPPVPPVQFSQTDSAAIASPETLRTRPAWGRIEIDSIGLSSMILEGIDPGTLRRGVGHIPGTALPGQPGNVALAGHRDTFFRALRNIHKDDEITLETLDRSYRYRVDFTRVVAPGYIEALNSSDEATLTLVTCYPFSFVGPAPQRYIVRAHRLPQ